MKSWVGIAFFGISMLLGLLPPTVGNRGVSMEILRLHILIHTFSVENEPTFQVSHLSPHTQSTCVYILVDSLSRASGIISSHHECSFF